MRGSPRPGRDTGDGEQPPGRQAQRAVAMPLREPGQGGESGGADMAEGKAEQEGAGLPGRAERQEAGSRRGGRGGDGGKRREAHLPQQRGGAI
ncbi:MAG: hypothetical protein E7K72_12495, partial [Roseomonas mucosa]|nr:hypothetical protein [Roseomonas mucosa]